MRAKLKKAFSNKWMVILPSLGMTKNHIFAFKSSYGCRKSSWRFHVKDGRQVSRRSSPGSQRSSTWSCSRAQRDEWTTSLTPQPGCFFLLRYEAFFCYHCWLSCPTALNAVTAEFRRLTRATDIFHTWSFPRYESMHWNPGISW